MSDTILRQDAIAIIEAASKHGAWASSHVAVGHVIEAINEMPSQPDPQVTALVEALRRCDQIVATYNNRQNEKVEDVRYIARNALNAWEKSNG